MYTKMLIPTDGSPLAVAAALKAIGLAKRLNIPVVAFYAAENYQYPIYEGSIAAYYLTPSDYKAITKKSAVEFLGAIEKAASAAGVACETSWATTATTAAAIAKAAKTKDCDVIFIGSHGRRGLSKLFLGSVTSELLAVSTVDVIVHRAGKAELKKAQQWVNTITKPTKAVKAA
ncbi:MAG: universal stress protein [Burkholderiaceae bacterium]